MADVFLGSVYATLELRNVNEFQRQLGTASDAGTGFKNTMLGVFAGNLLTQGFQLLTQSVVGFAKEAITGAADLQSSMGLLAAVTGATQAQMKVFNDTAIALGNDITLPAVSAADAADAMIELGKAGLSVNDVLGASKGVLQAAAAGNIAVADSAKIVSGALLTFGLKGTEASRVADVLAAAANASSLELGDVGLALTQAGAQASIAGLSMEQTVGIIAQMANKGISAQQAGTSLSYMLKSLVAPTDKAAGVMEDLGLKFFDADGKFIGVRESIAQLTEKTKGLTQEQRAQALSTIFGAEALKSANVLINDGTAGYDKMQVAISKTGAANDLAKARQIGFNGAMSALQNTIETTALQIGQVFLPVLTNMANFASQNLIPILSGVGAGLVALIAYFVVTGISAAAAAAGVTALDVALGVLFSPVVLIVAGVIALVAGLVALYQNFQVVRDIVSNIAGFFVSLYNAFKLVATGDFTGGIFGLQEDSPVISALITLHDILKQVGDFVMGQLKAAWDVLVQAFNSVKAALQPLIDQLVSFYKEHAPAINAVLKAIAIAFGAIVLAPLIIAIAAIVAVFVILAVVIRVVAEIIKVLVDVMLFCSGITMALVGIIVGAFIGAWNALVAVINFVGNVIATVIMAIWTVITTVFNAIMVVWNTVLKPVFDAIVFVISALFTIWTTIWTGIFQVVFTIVSTIVQIIGVILFGIVSFIYDNILVPIGQFFATIWNGIVTAVTTAVNAVMEVVTTVFNAVWGVISSVWNTIYGVVSGVVSSIFNTVSSVFNSIWTTITNIVNGVLNTVRTTFNNVKTAITDAIQGGVNIVTGFVQKFLDAGKNIIDGIVNGIKNGKDAVVNKIKDICAGALDAVKNFFGIKSPSKVMAKMFGYVMQGGVLGINQNSGALLSAFNDATSMLPSAMSIPITATGSYAGSVGSAANGGNGIGNSVSNNNGNVSVGEVNVYTRQDDSRFLQLIGRNTELAGTGIVGAGS